MLILFKRLMGGNALIYTVTFNPAIDYVVSVDNFRCGEEHRTGEYDAQLGGKGINVSVVLNNLGIVNTALGFIGGFTGEYVESELKRLGIKTDMIRLDEGLTRINIKIKSDSQTEINASGPYISENNINKLFLKLDKLKDGDVIILAGSIPESIPHDIYEKIIAFLSDRKIMFVVDAVKDVLTNVLKYRPFLIKPNNFELEDIFQKKLETEDEIVSCASVLQSQGAKNVLVSLGADGSVLLDENGVVHKMSPVKGKCINAVGAGDSMVAGFVAGYLKTKDYDYALKLGTSAGSATAFSLRLGTKDEILSIMKSL